MKKIKNILLVIEGGDGAGKGTQTTLLSEKLKSLGHIVTVFDFPQYEASVFGKLVGECLKGDHGDFKAMSSHIASLPYMLDRLTASPQIRLALKKGIVLCNRYTPSNTAFQSSKLSGKKKAEFISFLENAEHDVLGIPKPTRVIYLYVPHKISSKLVGLKDARSHLGGKKGAKDQYEKDQNFQRNVVKTYVELSKRDDWRMIDCAPRGELLTREVIHDEILQVLSDLV